MSDRVVGPSLPRRDVLRLAAGALVAVAAGCSGPSAPARPSPSSTSARPTTASTTPSSSTAAPPDWDRLATALRGDLVRPGQPAYAQARELFNPRFDRVRPEAVAYCETAADVATAVSFARDSGVPLALRAGGHSYAGWSTGSGLVVDVSRMSRVQVSGTTAVVGAGAKMIDLYAGVARQGMALPAGSCPTVGVAGLTLGGGQGVLSRAWGLTCDNLTAVEIVTADGRRVTADADHEPDLFWACRGGGGGSFGVVTRLRFALHPAQGVTTWYRRWDYRNAADAVAGWQGWAAGSPRRMWSTCKLLTRPGESTPSVQVSGTWLGNPAGLDAELVRLVDAVSHRAVGSAGASYGFLPAMLAEAGCSTVTAARCSTLRTAFGGVSHVLADAMPSAAIATAVDRVARRHAQGHPRQAGVSFDVLGGAVADLAPDATAFPHRRALAVAQYTVGWPVEQHAAAVSADLSWLHGFRNAMTPYVGNAAYVNYADPRLADWQHAYYGANYPRLQKVKSRVDPDGLFRFPQAIEPAG